MVTRFARRALYITSICVALLLSACVTPPVQEMSDARQAIHAAHQVEAARIAPDLMESAMARISEAEHALGRGDYQAARSAALQAKRSAIEARTRALAERGR